MSMVDRQLTRPRLRDVRHAPAGLRDYARLTSPVSTFCCSILSLLVFHLLLTGLFIVLSLQVGADITGTPVHVWLVPFLVALGLVAVVTIVLVQEAGLRAQSFRKGFATVSCDPQQACLRDLIQAMDMEARSLLRAAETVHCYDFIELWNEQLEPSARAVLHVFDKLPIETLAAFRSLFLVLSIRSQFQELLAASKQYAQASSALAQIRPRALEDVTQLQAFVELRETMRDKWFERIQSRHVLLNSLVSRFISSHSPIGTDGMQSIHGG